VCCDLSGNFEKFSMDVMHETRQVFLVSTHEVGALHLARERVRYLDKVGLKDRGSLLLNRCPKIDEIKPKDVESLVGVPIAAMFPNDYREVQRALSAGKPVEAYSAFVESLTGRKKTHLPAGIVFLNSSLSSPRRQADGPESLLL
jgi:Flp pilus assembly CpaE family ATPase